jgi:hypothetical protein
MIYKFETEKKESDVVMEVQKIENEISISIGSDKHSIEIVIKLSKEKLYDLIGALHSIQGKMRGGSNGTR